MYGRKDLLGFESSFDCRQGTLVFFLECIPPFNFEFSYVKELGRKNLAQNNVIGLNRLSDGMGW